jgi:hypothetical protein
MATRTKVEIKYLESNRTEPEAIKVGFDSHIWVHYSRIQAACYGESKLADLCKNYFNARFNTLPIRLIDLIRRESKSVLADGLASSCHIHLPNSNILLLHLQRGCHQPPFSTSCLT